MSTPCRRCSKPVYPMDCAAGQSDYHRACFSCVDCGLKLTGKRTHPSQDGQDVVCDNCYGKLEQVSGGHVETGTCVVCNEVLSGRWINALDETWHKNCFRCPFCPKDAPPLVGVEYYGHNGWPYCKAHIQDVKGVQCTWCHEVLPAGDQCQIIDEKPYHMNCALQYQRSKKSGAQRPTRAPPSNLPKSGPPSRAPRKGPPPSGGPPSRAPPSGPPPSKGPPTRAPPGAPPTPLQKPGRAPPSAPIRPSGGETQFDPNNPIIEPPPMPEPTEETDVKTEITLQCGITCNSRGIVCQGRMWKKGGSIGGVFKSKKWKVRYFVLTTDLMQYYHDKKDEARGLCLGDVNLDGAKVVIQQNIPIGEEPGFFYFYVQEPGGKKGMRRVHLRAVTDNERSVWADRIARVIETYKSK